VTNALSYDMKMDRNGQKWTKKSKKSKKNSIVNLKSLKPVVS